VLLLNDPTRGVDVGAKAEIHGLLSELAAARVGILMISSELPEILAMSDRVLVMHAGCIVGEIPGNRATQEQIMRYATGHLDSASAPTGQDNGRARGYAT
jgi:ABC-type sugar transport system ATPase subunit